MMQAMCTKALGIELCISAFRYLRQIAVITPYAEFKFTYTAEEEKSSIRTTFARRTDKMPASPKVHLGSSERTLISLAYASTSGWTCSRRLENVANSDA